MEWMIVVSLVLFGLLLLVVEVIFVPGTTVVGVAGFVFLVLGIGLAFRYFGSEVGWITTGGAALAFGVVFYFSFKTNVWKRFSLKSAIKSKVNEGETENLVAGEEGVAISALRPVGKAELTSKVYEVKTQGQYLDSGTRIRIVKIISNQIFVEPIL
jgi:membrane-bound ClpP family serine protease